MLHLLAASLIWALPFGLIKHYLGDVDASLVACVRLGLSLVVFLPFLRTRNLTSRLALGFLAIGAVQYGMMYLLYIHSFAYLAAHEVALLTIFTPIYVTILNDVQTRRFHRVFLLTAVLAVAGCAILLTGRKEIGGTLRGVTLMQLSNLCWAFGQVRYRQVRRRWHKQPDHEVFGLLYLGAFLVALPAAAARNAWPVELSRVQLAVLLYLGVVPSGLAFYLWNVGATRTNAGALAILNNAKIPLAVAVSLLVFGESTDLVRLFAGGGTLLAAIVLNEMVERRTRAAPPGARSVDD